MMDAVVYKLLCILSLIIICTNGGIINRLPLDQDQVKKLAQKENKKDGTDAADGNDDLGPPDHRDAVRMEKDGHVNEEFHQEIFLGEEKHSFQDISAEEQKKKLEEIFNRADKNQDGFIDETELQEWIFLKTQEHLQQARKEADEKFYKVDLEKNGIITYEDFVKSFTEHFEKKYGMEDKKRYENRLEVIRQSWKLADLNHDGKLDKSEFVLFQHPELSNNALHENVDFFLTERDFDGDGHLNLLEFVFGFPVDEVFDIETLRQGDELLNDRVHQFEELLDINKDKKGSREELFEFLNPMSKINARNEAHEMIWFADTDEDKKLSLKEVQDASHYFTGTKLYNVEKFFHNEL